MGAKAEGMESENGEVGEWEQVNDERIRRTGVTWWGRNWKRIGGSGDEGGSGWGYGQEPSEYSEGIDRPDNCSYSARGDDKSGKPGGNAGGWRGGEPESALQSTKTLRVGGRVLRQTSRGRTRRKCSRRRCGWTRR